MNLVRRALGCILVLFVSAFLFGGSMQLAEAAAVKRRSERKLQESSRITCNLSGKWEIEASKNRPETWTHSIVVPGLVDMAEPSINWEAQKCFWYKKTFTLTPSQTRSHAFLKIDQSKYGTEVWLNGKYLGSYLGCYTSHRYSAAKAINYNGENIIIVKVGTKDALPKNGAVGHDYEKKSFIPGIWGDVSLILSQNPIIERVQLIPHIDAGTAEARITLKNLEKTDQNITLSSKVFEKALGLPASDEVNTNCVLKAKEEKIFTVTIPIPKMQLWSPDNPFLYQLITKVKAGNKEVDIESTTFGMREFKIVGSDFYLNGKRIFLKGSNIAFHRFLSDPDRKGLPWDEDWIKKILVDIPKAHNFNFFRNHLGQMYNKWYDIADECGMLVQNEWAFWVITGREKQIRKEFTQWVYDNWNHPSIIIWDAMNEPHDDGEISRNIIRDKIIPELKELDPTRPWECGLNPGVDFESWKPNDFSEDHPYIFSMGPALNKNNFGNSRSIEWMENSKEPTMLNEFVWFWLGKNGQPASLMGDVLPRWLGKNSTSQQRLEYQAFLASELCELFRRMEIDGIVPFVYLSIEGGCTSNWFTGDISNPGVKPIMAALKDAFAPFGVSVELWDRHFFSKEKRSINVYIFNDTYQNKSGVLNCKIVNEDGTRVFFESNFDVTVPPVDKRVENVIWAMPSETGSYYLEAELIEDSKVVAASRKIAHVSNLIIPDNLLSGKIMVYDPDNEILNYLTSAGLKNVSDYNSSQLSGQNILVLGEGALLDKNYKSRIDEITGFVKNGHSLIIIEPSYGINNNYEKKQYPLLSDLVIEMNKREDKSSDGYDSYCFAEDMSFSLWNNIDKEHLKMFNGGWGGEMISQCDVSLKNIRTTTLAKSGMGLKHPNVMEAFWGKGVIVLSRIQIRGRLTEESDPAVDLYSRRVDVIAQQYLLNLLSTYLDTANNFDRMKEKVPFYIKGADVSSIQENNSQYAPEKAIDGDMSTRWSSRQKDPQWIVLDFGEAMSFSKIILHWEAAYGKQYEIQISDDAKNWKTIHTESNSDGKSDVIKVKPQKAKYMRVFGTKRGNNKWGYSLWEIEVN